MYQKVYRVVHTYIAKPELLSASWCAVALNLGSLFWIFPFNFGENDPLFSKAVRQNSASYKAKVVVLGAMII